jgi:8-oxo-dGTP pyrophosphatase MutT (NUDIX family)
VAAREDSEWLRRAAASNDRVAVVDRSGRLVNVGTLCPSNGDERKVVFCSESSSGVADVWLDGSEEADEFGSRIVPMTPGHEERWRLVWKCRKEIPWNQLPSDVLRKVLVMVPTAPRVERYVLGFCFSPSLRLVVLVRKTFPPWQAGRLNGLGGHVEQGEEPADAVAREFREESGCDVELDWGNFGMLRGPGREVHLFCARCHPSMILPYQPNAGREGMVDFHRVDDVLGEGDPERPWPLPDLRYLVPMALNFLRGDTKSFLDVEERGSE